MAAEPLLRRINPATPTHITTSSSSPSLPRPSSSSTFNSRRPAFPSNPSTNKKRSTTGPRSWIRVDAVSGASSILEADKLSIMRRCDLPARDLRLLDPLFVYPSAILGREKAIVVNLEQIRCIITADELLLLNSLDSYVLQYTVELQRRMAAAAEAEATGAEASDRLPFEFRALELALEVACNYLDSQAAELEIEAYPLLDELTSKISTLNLERVRRLKSRLVALTRRVQKVREEIEHLMDDDGDMAEMYLTEKKHHMLETSFLGDHPAFAYSSAPGAGISVSAPVSPASSPSDSHKLEKTLSISRSRQDSVRSSENAIEHIQELEMLLEAYFVMIDSTLNKLTSLKEYIDDTEDFINIQLDNVRNQLIQFELLLTTATFVVAIFGVIAGIFGMNFEIPFFQQTGAFQWVLIISGLGGFSIFGFFLWFLKCRRLMPL
ncbi:Magnesium transporter MRS2-1 [Rhynchospora pubera]|uniref:Magnesium transporter n=1 Tax=Rhynchospora pubera TaxID=906938 RepID=A0AAV8GY43_9POAL|nr:Magnesium transporter MRS2-1 [Rhynchospora pubera]KAJ4758128.1 Magnesium transporter MRS2-1 [Rhynchospora pubera]KAJ4798986.1 Magnesium transporter MRS2-1 [Rhynchospora pubera]KAJ4810583.1 Magnesium transporter MRS2-1 [Rhynchospora pubera]